MHDRGHLNNAEMARKDVGARPRSEVTGQHDSGSGANETIDGFDRTSEEARHRAEEIPTGDGREDRPRERPVFERGRTAPKV